MKRMFGYKIQYWLYKGKVEYALGSTYKNARIFRIFYRLKNHTFKFFKGKGVGPFHLQAIW